jgi:hypothetical protein
MDSDICLHCNHDISENDKRMEMPCCETVYHTNCVKNMINAAVENHYNNMICSCGELFVRLNNWAPSSPHTDTNIVISEEARAKIAEYKATLTQFRKNRILFNKKLKEESTSFKEDVEPLLEQIKERRKTALEALKNSDAYKGAISVIRSLRTKLTRFRNTFNFDRQTEIKELYGGHTRIYYELRYSYPITTVRRLFRLKLNTI